MTFIALSPYPPPPLPAPHTLPRIFMLGIRRRVTSRCPRLPWEKRECKRCDKERRPTTENTQLLPETFANWFRRLSCPATTSRFTPVGNGIRARGAHRKRGEQWELSFITGPPRGTMRRNCVTTRVRIYYIDGAVRAKQSGGRAKGDMCFLASREIITLELTAN